MNRSLKFMLLGIALLLFSVAFPQIENALVAPFFFRVYLPLPRYIVYLIGSIFPIAGIILAFVGFFMRSER